MLWLYISVIRMFNKHLIHIKMKNLFLLTCFVLLMTSCSVKTYYQIVDVKSTNLQKESNNYVYNDGVCKIVYNFWSNGGNAGFSIENLSDDVIYVDLGNTFYIVNGIAKDYSSNCKLVTELKSGIVSVEKTAVAIPPHASKIFSEYTISKDVIQDCSVKLLVKKNQPEGKVFTESESPVSFRNYITYRKDNEETAKVVSNDFYVAGITNYQSSDIVKKARAGCKKTLPATINEKYSPGSFYIKYVETHSTAYSADVIGTSSRKV